MEKARHRLLWIERDTRDNRRRLCVLAPERVGVNPHWHCRRTEGGSKGMGSQGHYYYWTRVKIFTTERSCHSRHNGSGIIAVYRSIDHNQHGGRIIHTPSPAGRADDWSPEYRVGCRRDTLDERSPLFSCCSRLPFHTSSSSAVTMGVSPFPQDAKLQKPVCVL